MHIHALICEAEFGKLGLGICYDLRFPEMAMIAARQGALAMICTVFSIS